MAYKAKITAEDNAYDRRFRALIVRVDRDGEENVIHGYKSRTFDSIANAEKSTAAYMAKHGLQVQQ